MLVYLFVPCSSFFEHRLFYSVRTQIKRVNPNFLLAFNTRCLSSDARKHGFLSKETCTYPVRRQPGPCHVFLLGVYVLVGPSFTYAHFLQTDICTTEENVYSRMTCISSSGPHSSLINHVLSLSLLLHLEKLRSSYSIDQLKNDIITNGET